MPGHFIGQCVLPVELIFLFLARGGADKVRTGHQPQSRQGARTDHSAIGIAAGDRGEQIDFGGPPAAASERFEV